MKKILFSPIFFEIIIIFILSLTPLLWFRPGMLMVGHDLVAPLDPKVFFGGRLSTWIDQFFGQSQTLILGTIIIHFIDVIPSYLGFSLETGQKIVYVFWFFLMGTSAYTLAHVLKPKSSVFKLTATVLYQFNFFILQGWWIAEKSKFSAYIAAPLILSVFILVESGRLPVLVGAVLGSIILFLFNAGGVYGLPLYGGFFVIIGGFILFSLIEHAYLRNVAVIKRILFLTISTLVLGLAVNSYFILPAMMKIRAHESPDVSQIGGVSGVISWATEISANASFLNLMRLEGIPDWYDNPEHPYAQIFFSNPLLIIISFLWPLIVFGALFLVKDRQPRRFVMFFFFVYLLGMFFTAGTHPPLGFLYELFVEKIPGFFIFRTPYYKFASALFFAFAFLVAFFIDSMPRRFRSVLFVLFIGIVFAYHFPFFTGNFFEWKKGFATRLSVPSYVFEFGRWLNAKNDNTRVLMLPPDSSDFQYSVYKWGYLSFQALPTLLSNASVVVNNDKLSPEERLLTTMLYRAILQGDTENVTKLASLLRISHVVLMHDTVSQMTSSIPLDPALYEQGMSKTGLFELEKRFGQWDVYVLKQQPVTKLYLMTGGVGSVDGTIDDVPVFLPNLRTNDFILKSDQSDVSGLGIGQTILVPECITCPKKNLSEVIFPERNILPGDPFYALVLFSENLKGKPKDPKGAIYNSLGITLKRTSEINQMMFEKRILTSDVASRYIQLLQDIKNNFEKLPSLKDKIEVGADIQRYLHAEQNYLRPNLGNSVTSGSQTVLSGEIFSAISSVQTILEPYVFLTSDVNSRVYQLNIDTPSDFRFLVGIGDTQLLLNTPTSLDMTLDDSVELKPVGSPNSDDKWISFNAPHIDKGFHTLKLTLPSAVETTYALQPATTEFSQRGENSCFGTEIFDIAHEKLYWMRLQYLNDFSDNLILFVWERATDGKNRLLSAVKLLAGPLADKKEEILESSSDANGMTIAICAPNLTSERAMKQFTLSLSDVVNPSVVMVSAASKTEAVQPVSYMYEQPTRYRVTIPTSASFPALLVFPERFDPWWELKGVNARHIRMNGYANGWIIDAPPTNSVVITYKGQNYFFWGSIVSAMTLIGGSMFLFLRRLW